MTDNLQVLADIAGELALDRDRNGGVLEAQAAFDRWVQANAPDEPLGERLLLAYLLDHPHWAPGTARTTAWAVDRCVRQSSGVSVVGELVLRYLQRLRGEQGATALPLVPALRMQGVVEIAHALDQREITPARHGLAVDALRDALVVARRVAPGADTIKAAMMSTSRLQVGQREHHPVLLMSGREEPVQTLSADGARQWHEHLRVLNNRDRVRRRVVNALARAGIDPATTVEQLSEDQWAWLWRLLDPDLPRLLRDRAYLLLGIAHARRHAELRRLDLSDVAATAQGYRVTYFDTKNDDDYIGSLTHAAGPDGACAPQCAACATEDLLDWERTCMGRTNGPAFATRYAGQVKGMTRQNGRHRVRELTGSSAPHPGAAHARCGPGQQPAQRRPASACNRSPSSPGTATTPKQTCTSDATAPPAPCNFAWIAKNRPDTSTRAERPGPPSHSLTVPATLAQSTCRRALRVLPGAIGAEASPAPRPPAAAIPPSTADAASRSGRVAGRM